MFMVCYVRYLQKKKKKKKKNCSLRNFSQKKNPEMNNITIGFGQLLYIFKDEKDAFKRLYN